MNVAFVTDEYPTSTPSAGGLATYVSKMARLLCERGIATHVFIPAGQSRTRDDGPVVVHEVGPGPSAFRAIEAVIRRLPPLEARGLGAVSRELATSWAISRAVLETEATSGRFDWIQSADYRFRGLFLSNRGRPNIVRCSWARDLFERCDGSAHDPTNRMLAWIERVAIRRAAAAYSPSALVSRYLSNAHRLNVSVIRPPLAQPLPTDVTVPPVHPPAGYLVHFGSLMRRKGTDLVLDAAQILASRGESVPVCIAGVDRGGFEAKIRAVPGCTYVGDLTRPEMASVLRQASAAVLPSRVDNLPNTAIESLASGIPVITTAGSSVDELVENGRNGWVVPQEDPHAIAQAMRAAWTSAHPHLGDAAALCSARVFLEMTPEVAVDRLLAFANEVRRS